MATEDDGQRKAADAALRDARALVGRLLAAVFVLLVVAAAVGLGLRYVQASTDGRRDAENLADVLSQYLRMRLVAVDSALSRVVAGGRRIGGPTASEREWAAVLRTATAGVTGLSAIVITDETGRIAYSTVLDLIGHAWADLPVFRTLSGDRPNRLVVEVPMSIRAGNRELIPFGRMLTDAKGEFIGAAIATLVPNQLEDFYTSFDLGRSGTAWVLLPTGAVLFRAGAVENDDSAALAELPALAIDQSTPPEGFLRGPLGPGGADYLTAYRRSDIADLVVAVSLAADDILWRWRYEALAVLAFLAVAGGLLLFVRRRIDRAMTDAVEAAVP